MPEQYVQLGESGVALPASWAGVSDGVLTIQLSQTTEQTFAQIVALFDNPTNTDVISFHGYDGEEKTFDGYTHIVAALDRRKLNHGVMVQLIKSEGE